MLDEVLGQHQRADGDFLKAARHTGVDDEIGVIALDEEGGSHGGVHLTHAAAAGDETVPQGVEADAVDDFGRCGAVDEAVDLRGHGVEQSSKHRGILQI